MKYCLPLLLLIGLLSCGYHPTLSGGSKSRVPASLTASPLHSIDAYFSQETDQKLLSLHRYYLVGRKNLKIFDQKLHQGKGQELFKDQAYHKLIAVKLKTQELESELIKNFNQLQNQNRKERTAVMKDKIVQFSASSLLHYLTMKNLRDGLQITTETPEKFDQVVLERQQHQGLLAREFLNHEMTIDHLAHALSFNSKDKTDLFLKIDPLSSMPQLPHELMERRRLMEKKGAFESLTEGQRNCKLKGITTLSKQETLCPQS